MAVVEFQDGFITDSSGWRPKPAPQDHYEVTVQVVQRFEIKDGKTKARKAKEINLDITHTADDTKAVFSVLLPMTLETCGKLVTVLQEAMKAYDDARGGRGT